MHRFDNTETGLQRFFTRFFEGISVQSACVRDINIEPILSRFQFGRFDRQLKQKALRVLQVRRHRQLTRLPAPRELDLPGGTLKLGGFGCAVAATDAEQRRFQPACAHRAATLLGDVSGEHVDEKTFSLDGARKLVLVTIALPAIVRDAIGDAGGGAVGD